ncbi:polysaccharide deacetylase family protein [Priestia sp. OVL9]|nr:polysaccharide deacetylase family protein [Priestia sp. OVL9]
MQSHTATHPDLTKTKNLSYELADSKRKIEAITSQPVIAVAYPYGKVNSRVVEETKKIIHLVFQPFQNFLLKADKRMKTILFLVCTSRILQRLKILLSY